MMSIQARRELLAVTRTRYQMANRTDKSRILDEFTAATQYHRKYAIGLLSGSLRGSRSGQGTGKSTRHRTPTYTPAVQRPLVTLWEVANRPCSKRLVPFLPELIDALHRHGELIVEADIRDQLLKISPATCDRLLREVRRKPTHRGLSTTKPGTLLRHQIPIRTFADWKESERRPGFMEVDLVAHCGEGTHGEYLHTLVLTDVFTGWTECVPLPNRSQKSTQEGIDAARKRLPFALLGLDSDNGSEFINHVLKRYCEQNQITFTRCRPYKKNDQCHVEQKNWSIVRQMIGYDRLEGERALRLLEAVYEPLRLYVNYFQPSLKLIDKQRQGAKVIKHYDRAQTPYRRTQAAEVLSAERSQELERMQIQLNPAQLLRQIHQAQDRLWTWAQVTAQVTSTIEATNAA